MRNLYRVQISGFEGIEEEEVHSVQVLNDR